MIDVFYYQVTYNADRAEGRGANLPTGIGFKSKEDALEYALSEEYAKKYGVMGTPGSKYNVEATRLKIYEEDEVEHNFPDIFNNRLRESALKKLSKEERIVLGLE